MSKVERPEALAQFAESARRGERVGVAGLTATEATTPLSTNPKDKDDAATRILAEGATGKDFHSEDAVARVPDRILESQGKSNAVSEETQEAVQGDDAPYDATQDPRTGRPPTPLDAQRLARDHELDRLSAALTPEEEADEEDAEPLEDEAEEDFTSVSEDDEELGDEDMEDSETQFVQAPARMVAPRSEEGSPSDDEDFPEQSALGDSAREDTEEDAEHDGRINIDAPRAGHGKR